MGYRQRNISCQRGTKRVVGLASLGLLILQRKVPTVTPILTTAAKSSLAKLSIVGLLLARPETSSISATV